MPSLSYGRSFDGTNDYVTIPLTNTYTTGTKMCWFWYNGEALSLAAFVSGGTSRGIVSITETGVIFYQLQYPLTNTVSYNTGNTTPRWIHIAYSYVGGKMYLYVDGVLRVSVTVTPNGFIGFYAYPSIYIGRFGTLGFHYEFDMVDFRQYNRLLSAAEMSTIYAKGQVDETLNTTGLIGRWFIGADNVNNSLGTGLNGTNFGSTIATRITYPGPSIPTAITPINLTPTSFIARWNHSTADGYRINVSTSPTMTPLVVNNLDVGYVNTYNVSGLTETIYYYQVRAYKTTYGVLDTTDFSNTQAVELPLTPIVYPSLGLEIDNMVDNQVFTVLENQTYVTKCVASTGSGVAVVYSLPSGTDVARFTINSSTGVLQFAVAPNYEVPTDANTDNVYELTVRATAGAVVKNVAIKVKVLNYFEADVSEGFNNSDNTEYLLKSENVIVQFETIEISHPAFTKTYRFVRNNVNGITATLETEEEVEFPYIPMNIDETNNSGDLDYAFTITIGDIGEIFPDELDLIYESEDFFNEATMIYRTFRSDDLSQPLIGPIKLKIKTFIFDQISVSLVGTTLATNLNKTGEIYTLNRFPMTRAFL